MKPPGSEERQPVNYLIHGLPPCFEPHPVQPVLGNLLWAKKYYFRGKVRLTLCGDFVWLTFCDTSHERLTYYSD